jgi:hypothetical protein
VHINVVNWQFDPSAVTVDFLLTDDHSGWVFAAFLKSNFFVIINCLHLNWVFHVSYNLFSSNLFLLHLPYLLEYKTSMKKMVTFEHAQI